MFTPRAARRAACALAFSAASVLSPYSADAAPQWEILFSSSGLDLLYGLDVAPDGSIYAAGYDSPIGDANLLTLKVTSTGSLVWSRFYNPGSSDFAKSVAVDPAGYVYVGGDGAGSGSAQDLVWAKYTSTGGLAGTLRYDSGFQDSIIGLGVAPDGNIVMGGNSNGDLRIIKFSPNGSVIWNTTYDSGTGDSGYRLALDSDGNVLLTGNQYTLNKMLTVKLSSSGVVQWSRIFTSTPTDEGRGIAADRYGDVYVAGYRGYAWEVGESGYSTTLLKYDGAGNLIWAKARKDGGSDVGETLAVDAMGNPVLAGSSGNDQRIWRYDPFGTLLNSILYPSGGNAIQLNQLHPNPDGTFLVAGYCCLKGWVFKDSFPSLKSAPGAPGSPFSAVGAAALTASWTANGNSADTAYRLDLSTASDFSGTLYSSTTLGVSATVSGLAASTPYYARAATTADGVFTSLGSTTTAAAPPVLSAGPFSNVSLFSLTASWGSTYPGGTRYYSQLSTSSVFAGTLVSSDTLNLSAPFTSLSPQTTYYARVATAPAGPFTALGSTVPLQFVRQELPSTVGYALRIAVADFDGDGDLDAALAQATTLDESILRNDGGGAFTKVTITGSGGASNALAACDFDSDGDLDLLVGNDSAQDEVVLRNDGALSFTKFTVTGTAGNTKGVACGDYDNDGDQDAVIANDTGQSLVLLRNNGALSFTQTTLAGSAGNNRDVKWLDYDSDGDLDIFAAQSNSALVMRNDGDAGFTAVAPGGTVNNGLRVALADYDLDGDLDPVLVNNGGGYMVVYRSNGAGAFSPLTLMSSTAAYDASWGDYDGDGDLDVLFAEVAGDDFLGRNDGGGVFTRLNLTGSKGNSNSAAWGDFDADGDLDVLLGKALTKNLVLMPNLANTVNAAPTAPGGVALSFADSPSSAALTVTWSAAAYDGAQSTAGLSYSLVVATAPMALSGDSMRVVSPSSFVVTWNYAIPPGGNAQKALYRVWPGDASAKNGVKLRLDLNGVLGANFRSDATYYFRLQTLDAGLARSTWSSETSAFILRSAPAASAALAGPTTVVASYSTSGAAGYLLQASTAPDFSGTLLTAAAGSTAASVTLSGLEPATTYSLRFGALWQRTTAWAAVIPASTTTAAAVAGCATSRYVAKNGFGDCTRIQACVDLAPASLAGDACVVLTDSGTYSESVSIQNKTTNGFRVRLLAADGTRPVLNPPAGASAGLRILNASVTVSGLAVVTTNTVAYGILVSSAQVTLSSVSVDSGGKISVAGIQLGTGAALSYASVTVQNADGVRIVGSANSVSFTSASVAAFPHGAFYLQGASSNTVSDSYGSGSPGIGAFLYHSQNNTLARMTLRNGPGGGFYALGLNDAQGNAVLDSVVSNPGGEGADLAWNSDGNVFERSSFTAGGSLNEGFALTSGRGNRFSWVYVESPGNNALSLYSGALDTVVEHSTCSTGYVGARALGTNGPGVFSDNLLFAPYGTALGLYGSSVTATLIRGYTATPSYPALHAVGDHLTLRDSVFENSAGDGGKAERTAYLDIARSTLSGGGGGAGLRFDGSSSNTVSASRLSAPGGVGLLLTSYLELFDMTTTTGVENAFWGLSVAASTAVQIQASSGVALSSSVLVGDSAGVGLSLVAENTGALTFGNLAVRGAGTGLAFGSSVLVATLTAVDVDASVPLAADATALPGGSRITVRDALGAHGGSLYEDDPLFLVDWVPDGTPFVPPQAPAAPTAFVHGPSSITWTWGPVSGAESYRVRASSNLTLFDSPVSTESLLTGLFPNATYSIRVAGFAKYVSGTLSASATAHTYAEPPAGLAALFVTQSSAALSWSLNGNPAGTFAELQRSTDAAAYAVRAGTLATTAFDTGLVGCTSYYYRVRNRNPAGVNTDFAGPLLVRTPVSTPSAPGDLSAQSVPGRRIALTWNPSATEGIVAYRLYKDTGSGTVDYSAPYAEFSGTTFSTTTVALSSGVLHLFGLRAVHRCGLEERNTHAVASAWALESLDGVRAGIKVPASGKKISGNRVLVMAEMDTGDPRDVSSILFQYRSTGSATWTDIPAANVNHPNPDREQPFFVHWDVTGLADRAYDLRAVASDVVGASDPAPGTITVLVDSVGFEVRETDLGSGRVKKEQAVSNETTNTVATAESGSAVVTKVVLPAGALNTTDATLSATPNPAALPAPPADATSLGASIEISLSNGQSLLSGGQTAAIVFNYPDDDGDGVIDGTQVRAENAQIQTFDVAANKWKQEFATTVDKVKRTLTGQTPHFSLFAAFGVKAANLDAIRVYPNPYKPNGGNADEGRPFSRADPLSGVIFDNLPAVVTIKIYTLTGRLVSEFGTSAGTGALQWDGKNDQGEDVASGGYFAVITSPGASAVVKKIGVIR